MYQKTTANNIIKCDACKKKIPAGSDYFDDSTYNSLYGKIEVQKSLCLGCGEKHNQAIEDAYQEYEHSQRKSRIIWVIVLIAINVWIVAQM